MRCYAAEFAEQTWTQCVRDATCPDRGCASQRAEDYAKYRPNYPEVAIDCILNGLDKPERLTAADIGAVTGISSRLLADRGVKVIAIEPNAVMKAAATPHSLVQFKGGSAENTELENDSVDLVTCFQAFHWFNPELTERKTSSSMEQSRSPG